jgi:hypothetical protein
MSLFPLKPTHAPVKKYYEALAQLLKLGPTPALTSSLFPTENTKRRTT